MTAKLFKLPRNVNDSQIYTDSEWREGKDSRDIKGLLSLKGRKPINYFLPHLLGARDGEQLSQIRPRPKRLRGSDGENLKNNCL